MSSQFESGFWDVYVTLLTLASIVGCAVLLWLQSRRKVAAGSVQTTGHVWDEDLGEYNNPMPSWWIWLFYLTVAFALGYAVLYPALGSFAGTLGWSQTRQLDEENAEAERRFGPLYEKYASQPVAELETNADALAIGQRLFLNSCAQCHASDGGGSRGFPNLTDKDWLYGGTPELIKATIANGRNGAMPAFGDALGAEGVKDAAHYVMSLSGGAHDSIRAARGADIFRQTCAACHGADGRGNAQLGAANLTDRIWLHGAGEAAIIETIRRGRTSHMPAHAELLTPAKIHLLTTYVHSLSAGK
jgi:cytochrome c oxidase cbb3-type subunit 3